MVNKEVKIALFSFIDSFVSLDNLLCFLMCYNDLTKLLS